MNAEIEKKGAFTVPAKLLNDIVSRLPNQPITIDIQGDTVTLTCGTGHYQMQGLDAEEFTNLPDLAKSKPMLLPSNLLVEGLQSTLFATSTDESKQMLTGVHLKIKENGIEFAATDGHRLAVSSNQPENWKAKPLNATVPARAFKELERLIGKTATDLMIRSDESQIVFEFNTEQGNARLSSRLLEGAYPNYQQLIPKQFENEITVERQGFLAALERIAVLATQKNNVVVIKIDLTNQDLILSADAPQFGSGKEAVPAQISGKNMEIAFNVKYIIEGLKAINTTEIQIKLNAPTSPVIISPLGNAKINLLVMPIQIRNL